MYITMSGAHGTGKSTLGLMLSKKEGYTFLPEVLDTTVAPPKIGPKSNEKLASQLWFLRQMILREQKLNSYPEESIVIADRNWQDLLIYSKKLLNDREYKILESVVLSIPKKLPDLEIILWAPEDKVIERIQKRDRIDTENWGENDKKHLKSINKAFYDHYQSFKDLKEVVLIDVTGSMEETYNKIKNVIDSYRYGRYQKNLKGF